jgi:hypothetical protein
MGCLIAGSRTREGQAQSRKALAERFIGARFRNKPNPHAGVPRFDFLNDSAHPNRHDQPAVVGPRVGDAHKPGIDAKRLPHGGCQPLRFQVPLELDRLIDRGLPMT